MVLHVMFSPRATEKEIRELLVAVHGEITAGPNPSRVGQAVTLTATVTSGSVPGVPTGTVEFFDGTTDLGPGSALRGSGTRATSIFVTPALSAGTKCSDRVWSPADRMVPAAGM